MIYAKGSAMLLTLVLMLYTASHLNAQKQYQKNPHVSYKVVEQDENWKINYTFRDPFFNLQTFALRIPFEPTQKMIDRFGVPMWLFEPYADTEENLWQRKQILQSGLFQLNSNTIEVDKSAVLSFYGKSFCRPIAEMIVSALADYGKDNRLNRVEMAMRYVQDIPYGIPTYEDDEKHFGGVSPPPRLLIEGYGDCDSKVLLFTGILMYLVPGEDIIFLNQPDHVLSAIKGNPENDQTFVRYKGEKYLIAETAGPGKRKLGEKGNYFRNNFKPETLNLEMPEIIPYAENSINHITSRKPENDHVLILTNHSDRDFSFQLSNDKQHWQPYHINSNQSAKINFENHSRLFIRIRDERSYVVYEVETGEIYNLMYNKRKQEWSIAL